MPSGEISRAARSALGWSRPELASRAKIGLNTVVRIEANQSSRTASKDAVVRVLRENGIKFLPAIDGEGEGIRLRPDRNLFVPAKASE